MFNCDEELPLLHGELSLVPGLLMAQITFMQWSYSTECSQLEEKPFGEKWLFSNRRC